MRKIFDVTNPFWTFIGRLVDAFLLRACWLICCIPIVTFGASTTAFYTAMMKDVADEDAHYIRAFFKSFKQNLGQGIVLGLIYLVTGGILAYAIFLFRQVSGQSNIYLVAEVAAFAFSFIWLFTFVYAFPLLGRFYNTIPKILMNAAFLSFKHFGWTLLMDVVLVAYVIAAYVLEFFPIIMIGMGLVVLIHAYILNSIFKPLIEDSMGGPVNPDEWTIPDEEVLPEEKAGELTEAVDQVLSETEKTSGSGYILNGEKQEEVHE